MYIKQQQQVSNQRLIYSLFKESRIPYYESIFIRSRNLLAHLDSPISTLATLALAPTSVNPKLDFWGDLIPVNQFPSIAVAFSIFPSTFVNDRFFFPVGAGASSPFGMTGLSFGRVTGKYTELVLAVSGTFKASGGLPNPGSDCGGWESHIAWKEFDDGFETETFAVGGRKDGAEFIALLLDCIFDPLPNRCVISPPKEFSELLVAVR